MGIIVYSLLWVMQDFISPTVGVRIGGTPLGDIDPLSNVPSKRDP